MLSFSGVIRNEHYKILCGTEACSEFYLEITDICIVLWLVVSLLSTEKTLTFQWRIICLLLCFSALLLSLLYMF